MRQKIEELLQRLQQEPELRATFRRDPQAVLAGAGIVADERARSLLGRVDLSEGEVVLPSGARTASGFDTSTGE